MRLWKSFLLGLISFSSGLLLFTAEQRIAAQVTPYNAVGGVFATNVYSENNTITSEQQLPQKIVQPKGFDAKKVYRLTQKTTLSATERKWLYNRTYVVPYFFYYQTSADRSERINVNHLTAAQQLELAQYTAKLINQFRRQLGLNALQITQNSEKMTLEYLKYRQKHHITVHPTVAQQNSIWYNLAVKYAGLSSKTAGRRAFLLGNFAVGENVAFDYRAYRINQQAVPHTMLALKVSVYNGIAMMLVCDNVYNEQWGHFINFTTSRLHTFGFGVQAGVKWAQGDARSSVNYVWLLTEATNDGSQKITTEQMPIATQVAGSNTSNQARKVTKTKATTTQKSKPRKAAKAKRSKIVKSKSRKVAKTKRSKSAKSKSRKVAKAKRSKSVKSKPRKAANAKRSKSVKSKPRKAANAKRSKTVKSKSRKVAKAKHSKSAKGKQPKHARKVKRTKTKKHIKRKQTTSHHK